MTSFSKTTQGGTPLKRLPGTPGTVAPGPSVSQKRSSWSTTAKTKRSSPSRNYTGATAIRREKPRRTTRWNTDGQISMTPCCHTKQQGVMFICFRRAPSSSAYLYSKIFQSKISFIPLLFSPAATRDPSLFILIPLSFQLLISAHIDPHSQWDRARLLPLTSIPCFYDQTICVTRIIIYEFLMKMHQHIRQFSRLDIIIR